MKRIFLLLAACLISVAASADPSGRLFFTPRERAALDRARQQAAAGAVERPAASSLTLNGIVKRSDGRNTLWLNDRPLASDHPKSEVEGTKIMGLGCTLKLPDSSRAVRLRVGQRFDAGSGTVEESNGKPAAPARPDTPASAPSAAPRS